MTRSTRGVLENIYCPNCLEWYDTTKVMARAQGSQEEQPWNEVLLRPNQKNGVLKFLRQDQRREPVSQSARAALLAAGWQPFCPNGHTLADSLDPLKVIGIIGNVSASKSHYIAGLVYELLHYQTLRHLDIDVSYLGDSGKAMDARIESVYDGGEVLPTTERGSIDGPFTYRMTVNASGNAKRYILAFFDVAGEDCVSLRAAAQIARYLFHSAGIIILLDPEGLPVPGRPLTARGGAPLTTRAIVDTLADGIENVSGAFAQHADPEIVIAVAKSDKVDWKDGAWPPNVWPPLGEERLSRIETRKALREHSESSRKQLAMLGGQGIVDAAETRFNRQRVHFARVSATGQAPVDGRWLRPEPLGCSIPVAQIIDALDLDLS